MEYRPLEGFVFAITPFNFPAIAGNLPAVAALMGNVVVWKPSDTQVYSAQVIMEIFQKPGLPDGVINMITCDGPCRWRSDFQASRIHPGATSGVCEEVFRHLWKTIGDNLERYKSYPACRRDGKQRRFRLGPSGADVQALVAGLIRGAFEFQGQKCSAASQAVSLVIVATDQGAFDSRIEDPESWIARRFWQFHQRRHRRRAFDKIKAYIDFAKQSEDAKVISGGGCDDSVGYFIRPRSLKQAIRNSRPWWKKSLAPF